MGDCHLRLSATPSVSAGEPCCVNGNLAQSCTQLLSCPGRSLAYHCGASHSPTPHPTPAACHSPRPRRPRRRPFSSTTSSWPLPCWAPRAAWRWDPPGRPTPRRTTSSSAPHARRSPRPTPGRRPTGTPTARPSVRWVQGFGGPAGGGRRDERLCGSWAVSNANVTQLQRLHVPSECVSTRCAQGHLPLITLLQLRNALTGRCLGVDNSTSFSAQNGGLWARMRVACPCLLWRSTAAKCAGLQRCEVATRLGPFFPPPRRRNLHLLILPRAGAPLQHPRRPAAQG